MELIVFNSNMHVIGGCETWTYNFCKRMSKYHNITLLYNNAHIDQLKRISKYVTCEKYDSSQKYECDICISVTSWGGYPDSVTSTKNEYWQIIHANYKELLKRNYKYTPWSKTTKHIAVSKIIPDDIKTVFMLTKNT